MPPRMNWKLYITSPAAITHSTHSSLEDALTEAWSLAMLPDPIFLRIEGPNGEQYDHQGVLNECSRRRQQQT
jgi:hypothetical protein